MQMKKIITRTRAQVYKIWLKALRSGEYKRTKGQLRKTAKNGSIIGYCCLGVLQDLAVKDGGDKWFTDNNCWISCPRSEVDEQDATPKDAILDFMGLDEDMVQELIELNDTKDRTLKEIADYIEKKIVPEVV
jgi:hypothetical protein